MTNDLITLAEAGAILGYPRSTRSTNYAAINRVSGLILRKNLRAYGRGLRGQQRVSRREVWALRAAQLERAQATIARLSEFTT